MITILVDNVGVMEAVVGNGDIIFVWLYIWKWYVAIQDEEINVKIMICMIWWG